MKQIIDISSEVSLYADRYPGDVQFSQNWQERVEDGRLINLSNIQLSSHQGSHIDFPSHLFCNAKGGDDFELSSFIGMALVIELEEIVPNQFGLSVCPQALPEKVILKTALSSKPWNEKLLSSISPALIETLIDQGVKLIGMDLPSVDSLDSKTLDSHRCALSREVVLLENLVLTHVEPGQYQLVALPLKIKDAEATPVRAVLIKEDKKG